MIGVELALDMFKCYRFDPYFAAMASHFPENPVRSAATATERRSG
jgi:hypothetical protein